MRFRNVWGAHTSISELQFGFKPGLSTTMCTVVIVSRSPKFMVVLLMLLRLLTRTVDHTILLDKLLSRGLPNVMVCFLLRGTSPSVCELNGMVSPQMLSVLFSYSLHRRFAEGVVTFQCGLLLGEYLCWCSCIC